jgi:hypothetical protein
MAYIEIDSFVEKFKNLWHAGLKASLTVEAEHGQASITLRAGLGSIPPPFHPPRPQTPRPYRGPAYHRRQERRQAARAAAEIVGAHTEQVSDSSHNDVVNEGEDQVADKATEVPTSDENKGNEAEGASEIFGCYLCDFKSNWENGLTIHLTRKHVEIEQLDGNATDNDEPKHDEKYAGSKHYWAEGRLGSKYQTFLDAHAIIEESD